MAAANGGQFDSGHHLRRSSSDVSLSGEIRNSSASECLSEVDLESGDSEGKLHLCSERDCRICHLGLEREHGMAIELGCSCKGDLGAAHKKCAETWFKIKGNSICEICGATAINIAGEQANEMQSTAAGSGNSSAAAAAPMVLGESRTFWHSRRIMNFLLACMVFAFVVSWLFHFKILS